MAPGQEGSDSPAVSVVVPAMNAAATLPGTLVALAGQDLDQPYEVIVVDDGSTDETAQIAERAGERVHVVRKERGGPGSARNRGVAEARGGVLAFTDADCFPTPSWLREGLAAIAEADLVQGAVLADPAADRGPFDRTLWVTAETALYQTANLLVRRASFDQAGGFEDWFRPDSESHFGEDVLFAWRARRAGARGRFAERAIVHHAVFPRGPRGYVTQRRRLAYFPQLARKVPEIRGGFLFGRFFLSPRSAAFDLALAGAVGAGTVASPVPLFATAPYLLSLGRSALGWRRRAIEVAAVDLVADLVGFLALAWGSVRHRSLVL